MAKDFQNKLKNMDNPRVKVSASKKKPEDTPKAAGQTETVNKKEEKVKGTPGRKQVYDYPRKAIHLMIDERLLAKWEEVKIVHGSNLTIYIQGLIEKDLNNNYDTYKKKVDMLNS